MLVPIGTAKWDFSSGGLSATLNVSTTILNTDNSEPTQTHVGGL